MKSEPVEVALVRQWSAWTPIAMSLAALALVLGHAAIFGIAHEADEGTPAHIFQILMAVQLPVVVYFAVRWLPERPLGAIAILTLQGGAWFAAIAAVYWLT